MIKVKGLSKSFGSFCALSDISFEIPEGCVFGLVGSNGAGKSTLIRLLAGVYSPDSGSVTLDEKEVYENPAALGDIAYISDELYFVPGANIERMAKLYKSARDNFDEKRLFELAKMLGLDTKKPISQFSKGMKRQTATILALACRPKLLMLDETFDGLDPVMRSVVKKLLVDEMMQRKTSIVISSHSLRELEDTCDRLALLHKGGMILSTELSELKTNTFKLQIAAKKALSKEKVEKASGCELLNWQQHGSVANAILRGSKETARKGLKAVEPIICDILPLSLEEIFTYETSALGYNFDELMGGEPSEEK